MAPQSKMGYFFALTRQARKSHSLVAHDPGHYSRYELVAVSECDSNLIFDTSRVAEPRSGPIVRGLVAYPARANDQTEVVLLMPVLPMDSCNPPVTLVTGPSRSGKSRWAEHLAHHSQLPVIYVATGIPAPDDPEWQSRIRQHQQRRPTHWRTLEPPLDLVALCRNPPPATCILVDSLGTWVAQFLELSPTAWQTLQSQLLSALRTIPTPIILVAEEVGWGVVPAYPSGRLFRDRLGELVQEIGTLAQTVYLVTGGWVLNLTQLGQPVPKSAFLDSAPPA